MDVSRSIGPVKSTVTLFASTVPRSGRGRSRRSLCARQSCVGGDETAASEALAIWRADAFSVVANYAYVRSRQGDDDVELTPRHSIGVDTMWSGTTGRPGGSVSSGITPACSGSRPIRIGMKAGRSNVFGVLVERRVRGVRLFVNGENLTDVRQTRWDPLLRPSRGVDGRWTVDAWALPRRPQHQRWRAVDVLSAYHTLMLKMIAALELAAAA